MSPSYDVIVIGLGGTGSAAAPHLSARGPRHPAHQESMTVARGFAGHGFEYGPVVGGILADLAPTGATAHPIGLSDPRRLAAAPA